MKKALIFCAILSILSACGGGSTPAAPAPAPAPLPSVTLTVHADSIDTRVGGYPLTLSVSSDPASAGQAFSWTLDAGMPGSLRTGTDASAIYTPPANAAAGASQTVRVKVTSGTASSTFSFELYPALPAGSSLQTLVAEDSGKFSELIDAMAAPDGSLLVSDRRQQAIYRVTPGGEVSVLAGLRDYPNRFSSQSYMTWSAPGELYVLDNAAAIVRVDTNGNLERVKGIPPIYFKDQLNGEGPMAFGTDGNLYFMDGHTIRKLLPDGTMTTFAGACDAIGEHDGDIVCGQGSHRDGTGDAARFQYPRSMVVDAQGNLLIADTYALRKVTMRGEVTTPLAVAAVDVRIDETGQVLFVGDNAVRRLNPDGSMSTLFAALGRAGNPLLRAVPAGNKRLMLVYARSVQMLTLP